MSERNTNLFIDEFLWGNPYKPLSRNEILSELAESRMCYSNGEGEDFDKALDEIGARYDL